MVVNVDEVQVQSMVNKNPQVRILKKVLDQAGGNDEVYNFLKKELESLIEEKKKGYVTRVTKIEIMNRIIDMLNKDEDIIAFNRKNSSFDIGTDKGTFKIRIGMEKDF